MRVVVAAAAGGVAKTTVALGLGETLAGLRADRVAVLDAHPLGGTAGLRVSGQRGLGLPALLAPGMFEKVRANDSDTAWTRWATVEHNTRLTVFGRDRPLEGDELTIDTYMKLAMELARHWPILVIDTGAPEGRGVVQSAVVQSADVLVAVSGTGHASVAATASWLRSLGIPPARRVGVVVPLGGGDPAHATATLATYCRAVVHVGADEGLAAEAAVPLLGRTRPATRDAFTQLAAMVMDSHTRREPQ